MKLPFRLCPFYPAKRPGKDFFPVLCISACFFISPVFLANPANEENIPALTKTGCRFLHYKVPVKKAAFLFFRFLK
jgi:hypothetical protein